MGKSVGTMRRDAYKNSGHSKSFGQSAKAAANGTADAGSVTEVKMQVFKKKIYFQIAFA